ncbi:MAG: tRNA (adenosine(37)-N6)-threonylcarbamoyltransferase complex ATPase subunit type 1 TsaE [Candidatus Thiodiazotropha sp.]
MKDERDMFSLTARGEAEQEAVGRQLARHCTPPCIIFLEGDLGAGKTTLVRGFLRGLGHTGRVKSPTYTLMEPYELGDLACYHFDLYRLADAEELEYLGLMDLLSPQTYWLVEWPEKGRGGLPPADLILRIHHQGESRRIEFEPMSEKATGILLGLQGDLAHG